MLLTAVAYVLHPNSFYLRWVNQRASADLTALVPFWWWSTLALLLRFSFVAGRTWLVEVGASTCSAYGVGLDTAFFTELPWYLFRSSTGVAALFFVWWRQAAGLSTLERLFRNARWLEREVAEMHGVFFKNKRDRRALFLMPLLYWAPLRKVFPVGGFYEVRTHALSGKLQLSHTAWIE